ncbi:hypothetical protein [Micromonospora costi]|uniref:hypothetical protein n=1 Tax=Micromonospora costi TaxID=1530042 RepID=UPI0011C40269|nr:hypothetical protein [Micromonospora costi]
MSQSRSIGRGAAQDRRDERRVIGLIGPIDSDTASRIRQTRAAMNRETAHGNPVDAQWRSTATGRV